MELLIQIGIFLASTFVIIKSADILVDNGEKLGVSLKIPQFIIGILVMAIGTSLPEMATGISAALKGETDLVIANMLGSDIANIFIGLGLIAFITGKSIKFKQDVFEVHFPILIMSALGVFISLLDRVITFKEGIVFVLVLSAYVWFLFSRDQIREKEEKQTIPFQWKYPLMIVIGLVGLASSADFLINSILSIATLMGIAKSALAASLVAIGTSIPEFAVGLSALKKGNTEMLIGNILGSNIFNILLVLSVTSFISPLEASDQTMNIILPFFISSVFVYWVSKKDKQITIQEGAAMTILYIFFLGKLFDFL